MNAINENLALKNPADLLEELKEKVRIRNQMGGVLYWNILNDECCQIANQCAAAGVDRAEIAGLLGKGNYR